MHLFIEGSYFSFFFAVYQNTFFLANFFAVVFFGKLLVPLAPPDL